MQSLSKLLSREPHVKQADRQHHQLIIRYLVWCLRERRALDQQKLKRYEKVIEELSSYQVTKGLQGKLFAILEGSENDDSEIYFLLDQVMLLLLLVLSISFKTFSG